jgi:hypothetical protein
MIVFDLACVCGFTFEGWFQDRSDFESQQTASLLSCPHCGSREIRKILSPTHFQSSISEASYANKCSSDASVSPADAEKALATLQKFVEENFEDVGVDLAKESLKIHYGVAEPRNLRGVTTESEEKKLKEEGIKLLKIPMLHKSEKIN